MFCESCGKKLAENLKFCDGCGAELYKGEPAPAFPYQPMNEVDEVAHETGEGKKPRYEKTQIVSGVVNRYDDAYRVAATIVALGKFIKFIGGLFFVVALLFSFGFFGVGHHDGGNISIPIIIGAAIVGALIMICGVLVAAQGQILRATLDNAVASSPFLTDAQRANVMGLKS